MGLHQASAVLAYAPFHDDCDHDHPCKLHVWLDTQAELKALDLSVFSEKFRATSKSAASGGGSTSGSGGGQTSSSSSIDHNHQFSVPNHTHHQWGGVMTTVLKAGGGEVDAITTLSYVNGIQTAVYDTTYNGGGSHSHQIYDHQHSVPAHVHDLVFGIYEYANAAAVKAYINDPTFSTPIGAFGTRGSATANGTFELINLSLLQYYDPDGSGVGKLGPGMNAIYLVPQTDPSNNPEGLLRIEANVRPKFKG